jgi:hypothetical protein
MKRSVVGAVRTKQLAERVRAKAGKRRRKSGEVSRPGTHWYGIEDYFDPTQIEAVPVKGAGFMMGVLEDMVVIEVPKAMASDNNLVRLGQQLSSMGIKALIIQEGVRFLRLRSVSDEERNKLDAIVAARMQPQPEPEAKPEVPDEAGQKT